MDNAKSKTEPVEFRSQGKSEWSSAATRLGIVLILICSCFAAGVRGQGTNSAQAAVQAATVKKYLADMDARGRGRNGGPLTPEQVEEFEQGLMETVKSIEQPQQEDPSTPDVSQRTILASAAVLAGVIILVGTLLPQIGRIVNKRFEAYSTSEATSKLSAKVDAEEKEFDQFIEKFQGGAASSQAAGNGELSSLGLLQRFLAVAPERLESIRSVFGQFGDVTDEDVRKTILGEMCELLKRFKVVCEEPEFKPVWQLTTSLEELVKQLKERPNCITPSSLRTTAGALSCLEHLCKPGVRLDRAMTPPPRFLAVDDEPICRFAVSTALKRAFSDPDLAADGNAGLAKAKETPYDAVFVDVEMPGMDGFELCSKIHLTPINANAPVVFVTSHSDFVSRKKSTEAGGYDLIAKPFLPLEFIVKAMTLILRNRLFPTVSKEATGVAEQAEAVQEAQGSLEVSAPSRQGGEMVLQDRTPAADEPSTNRVTRDEPVPPELAALNGVSDTESDKDEEIVLEDLATADKGLDTTPEKSDEPMQSELASSNGVSDTESDESKDAVLEDQATANNAAGPPPEKSEQLPPELAASHGGSDTEWGEDEEMVTEEQPTVDNKAGTTPDTSEEPAQPELAASGAGSDIESREDEEILSEDEATVGNEVGMTPETSEELAQPELAASGAGSDMESPEDEEILAEDQITAGSGVDSDLETSEKPVEPELVASGADSDAESREDEEVVVENRAAASDVSGAKPQQSEEPPQTKRAASGGGSHTEKLRKLRVLSRQLRAVTLSGDTHAQQAALDEIGVCLKPTVEEAVRRGVHLASKIGLALGSLIKKLRDQPKFATVSALNTVAAALDLLDEFCVDPSATEVGDSELQILVVDDDPVSRRMMGTALQLMFGRPDVAESGEDAVRLAIHSKFDVIFMDVLMPKLDGFGACQKIREAGRNQKTPVVFVTSETSPEAQDRGTKAGGNGFVPKPVMPAEIFVAATVFGYTGRLRARRPAVAGGENEQSTEREVRSGEPALES
jgi:CheY-like chemotaxis protein